MKKRDILLSCFGALCLAVPFASLGLDALLSAHKNDNEAAAIGSLKAIANAQTLYREADKDGDGTLAYSASLDELGRLGLVPAELADGEDRGYRFRITTARAPQDQFVWVVNADPLPGGGDRHFGGNMAGLIFFNAQAPVTFGPDGSSTDAAG